MVQEIVYLVNLIGKTVFWFIVQSMGAGLVGVHGEIAQKLVEQEQKLEQDYVIIQNLNMQV